MLSARRSRSLLQFAQCNMIVPDTAGITRDATRSIVFGRFLKVPMPRIRGYCLSAVTTGRYSRSFSFSAISYCQLTWMVRSPFWTMRYCCLQGMVSMRHMRMVERWRKCKKIARLFSRLYPRKFCGIPKKITRFPVDHRTDLHVCFWTICKLPDFLEKIDCSFRVSVVQ